MSNISKNKIIEKWQLIHLLMDKIMGESQTKCIKMQKELIIYFMHVAFECMIKMYDI